MSFAAPGLLGQRVTSGSLAGVVVGWADGYLLVAVDEDDGRRVRRVDWQALTIDAAPVDRPVPTGRTC